MKVLAGIVIYNPNLERLRQNIDAIAPQVDEVILFINGKEYFNCVFEFPSVKYIKSEENKGVAFALKEIMQYAIENSFDWVLTVDQDSVCYEDIVDKYKEYVTLPCAGALTCNIVDRNFIQPVAGVPTEKYKEIPMCITAGMFMNVDAYSKSDGYDTKLFIDAVDWDICYNLRSHGYKVYRINIDGVLHEVGHGKNVTLLGKKYITYNEPPFRNYYSARNTFYLVRKYPEYTSKKLTIIRELRTELLILLYEENKMKKIASRWKGINDVKNLVF